MDPERELILVVEDEEDVSRYLAAALEDEGYEVLTAYDSNAGIHLLLERRPDLVCLDLVMPGRTGLSLYREIRSSPDLAGIPVVVVTGISPPEAESRLGLGDDFARPDAYIEKPLELPKLLDAIRNLLLAKKR